MSSWAAWVDRWSCHQLRKYRSTLQGSAGERWVQFGVYWGWVTWYLQSPVWLWDSGLCWEEEFRSLWHVDNGWSYIKLCVKFPWERAKGRNWILEDASIWRKENLIPICHLRKCTRVVIRWRKWFNWWMDSVIKWKADPKSLWYFL